LNALFITRLNIKPSGTVSTTRKRYTFHVCIYELSNCTTPLLQRGEGLCVCIVDAVKRAQHTGRDSFGHQASFGSVPAGQQLVHDVDEAGSMCRPVPTRSNPVKECNAMREAASSQDRYTESES
jgi:hypothetical protein